MGRNFAPCGTVVLKPGLQGSLVYVPFQNGSLCAVSAIRISLDDPKFSCPAPKSKNTKFEFSVVGVSNMERPGRTSLF